MNEPEKKRVLKSMGHLSFSSIADNELASYFITDTSMNGSQQKG